MPARGSLCVGTRRIQATLAVARAITCSCTPQLLPYAPPTCPHPTPLVALGLRVRDAPPRCVVLAGASLEPVDTRTPPLQIPHRRPRRGQNMAHDTTVVCRLCPLIHSIQRACSNQHRMDVRIPRPPAVGPGTAHGPRLFEGGVKGNKEKSCPHAPAPGPGGGFPHHPETKMPKTRYWLRLSLTLSIGLSISPSRATREQKGRDSALGEAKGGGGRGVPALIKVGQVGVWGCEVAR